MNAPIMQVERLDELEAVISKGLATFIEVGAALTEIREQRLYRFRDGFTSFEQYCKERWGFSRVQAHRLIEASAVASVLPNGNKPRSEAIARELAPLKNDPPKLRETWAKVTAIHDKPTARDVREVREALRAVSVDDVEAEIDEKVSKALDERAARRVFEVLSAACSVIADMKPPSEFLAALPGPVSVYPTIQLRRAHEWLGAFFQEYDK